MTYFSLGEKVALITGARRGIGKTIALAYAQAGADVVVGDIVIEDGQLEAVAQEIRHMGRRCVPLQVDTTRKGDVDQMVMKALDQFGCIDILVNNAGIIIQAPILETKEEDWDRLMTVDLKGYFLCSQAVGRTMVERKKGNIISLASQFAFKTTEGMGMYSVAKAGVVMLTRVLAHELGRHGIRANAIAPSLVKTEFSREGWSNPGHVKRVEATIPLGRLAETTDLAGAALFLASDASAYMTGGTLLLDGGTLA